MLRIAAVTALALSVSGCALFAPAAPDTCQPGSVWGCSDRDGASAAPQAAAGGPPAAAPSPPASKPDTPPSEPEKPGDKPDRPGHGGKPGHGHGDKNHDHDGPRGRDGDR